MFLDALKSGSGTLITNESYLRIFGQTTQLAARDLWRHIVKKLRVNYGSMLAPFDEEIDVILNAGNLSDRIIKKMNGSNAPEKMAEIYQDMCACVEQNKFFV